MRKIKVIIVDDSVLIQKLLTSILNSDPDIAVVAMAENPILARQVIKVLDPDVMILDIDMPEMDGLTFLDKVMRLRPMPVIMCSSFTPHCREVTLEAFRLGVVDIISKPISAPDAQSIIAKVKAAAEAKINRIESEETASKVLQYTPDTSGAEPRLFAIGASTGGTEALKELFQVLPENFPPIVVTQHLPEGFGAMFAERADQCSKLTVAIAQDGDKVQMGHAYIAPAGKHMEVDKKGNDLIIRIDRCKEQTDHIPSVDVMMKSVAKSMKNNVTAILLTGMGDDGAKGMLEIQNAGGKTIAQDEQSSVVWGMPRAAVELGAAQVVAPLKDIPSMMLKTLK